MVIRQYEGMAAVPGVECLLLRALCPEWKRAGPRTLALQTGHPTFGLTLWFAWREAPEATLLTCLDLLRMDAASLTHPRVGLETMDVWYSAGDYAKCVKLAERLIEIDPLDEGLHDFLIRATAQVKGVSAARTVCWESRTLFAREVGHVPPLLDTLAQQLQHKLPN